jgi:hypothetical protein
MGCCPSCGAYPGTDHHEACTVRSRGLRNRDRSESIQKLIDENQQLQEQLAEARSALRRIKRHQEVIAGSLASGSGAWVIADKALAGGSEL